MICTNCNGELPDDARVCGFCGHRLKSDPAASPPPPPPPTAGAVPVADVPEGSTRRRWPVFALVAVLTVVGAGIAVAVIFLGNGGPSYEHACGVLDDVTLERLVGSRTPERVRDTTGFGPTVCEIGFGSDPLDIEVMLLTAAAAADNLEELRGFQAECRDLVDGPELIYDVFSCVDESAFGPPQVVRFGGDDRAAIRRDVNGSGSLEVSVVSEDYILVYWIDTHTGQDPEEVARILYERIS